MIYFEVPILLHYTISRVFPIFMVFIRLNRYTTERLLRASGFFALAFLRLRAERPFGHIKLSLDLNRDIIKNETKSARI